MGCCSSTSCNHCVGRRQFLAGLGLAGTVSPLVAQTASVAKDPNRQAPIRVPLRVKPILIYSVPQRREATSWREWGGLMTEEHAAQEKERIGRELAELRRSADFPVEIEPPAMVRDAAGAEAAGKGDHDVRLVYAAGGSVRVLEAATTPDKWNVIFIRHRSGPVYLWYEIMHPRFLRKTVDQFDSPGVTIDDVVVDSYAEVSWKLRALQALKNTLGKRVVAVGGPGGWGVGGSTAPENSGSIWKMDLQTVEYPDLGERIKLARANDALMKRAHAAADKYLNGKGVTLETSKEFVQRAFVLTEVFRDLLDEAGTDAITINSCMATIMPMSETTACLPLSLLNDAGYMAFCESDFVVIPSGILLHYISGKPVFMNDPTYPHDGMVTIAHCTAPRRMDGKSDEPVRLLTHFESDYGAAPKVEMRKGQLTTNLIPDFGMKKWVGFEGNIIDAPFLPICRSQVDISVNDTGKVLREMGGFHWMTCYGSYLKEAGYAMNKLGVEWVTV